MIALETMKALPAPERKPKRMSLQTRKLLSILRSLKRGVSISASCKAAQIDTSNFWRWRQKEERIARMTDEIIGSRIQSVEDSLFGSAMKGNVTAQIFFLTNRAPERWMDKRAVVNNQIINRVSANGGNGGNGTADGELFAGEDRELQQRLLARLQRASSAS